MTPEAERLVVAHIEWARRIAAFRARRLPSYIQLSDLESEAMFGLVKAAQAFDPGRGVKFRTWAERKIKGAIGDWLREIDHLSQYTRIAIRDGAANWTDRRGVPRRHGRDISDLDQQPANTASDRMRDLPRVDPTQEHAAALAVVLKRLPGISPRAAEALYRHAILDEAMLSIAKDLEVTESRVCQLVKQARQELAVLLGEAEEDEPDDD